MQEKFGIYLNKKELKVLRISSPYWIPSGGDWVLITPDGGTTMVAIREIARQKNLVSDPDKLEWGELPAQK